MRIRQIDLEHFAGHELESVKLPEKGFIYLTGPSGVGKSSFAVDALCFALYGSRATRARKQEDLFHWDFPDEPLKVRVALQIGDEILVVERSLERKKGSSASVWSPGKDKPLAEGPSAVNRYLRDRLGGLSAEQLQAAFVARQEEINALANARGSQREKLVHGMLGMRELELMEDESSKRLTAERAALRQLLGGHTGEAAAELKAELEERRLSLAERHQALGEQQRELGELDGALQTLEAELLPLRAAQATVARLEPAVKARAAEIITVTALLQRSSEAKVADAALPGQRELVEKLDLAYEQSRSHYQQAKRRDEAKEKIARAQGRLAEMPKPIVVLSGGGGGLVGGVNDESEGDGRTSAEMRARVDAIRAERSQLVERRRELSEQRQRLAHEDECYACLQPLSSDDQRHRVLAGLDERIVALAERDLELAAEQAEIERTLPEQEEAERLAADAQNAYQLAEAFVAQAEEELDKLGARSELEALGALEELIAEGQRRKEALDGAKSRLSELEATARDLDPEAEERLAALKASQASEETELERAREALAGQDEAAVSGRDQERERLLAEVNQLRGSVSAEAETLQELEREMEARRKVLQAAERYELERVELEQRIARLERLLEHLKAFKGKLAAEIRPALEALCSEMVRKISHERFTAVRLGENYELTVVRAEGNEVPAHMLSGGQKVRLAVCLRLALTRLVSQRMGVPIEFLCFDEPLPSQDEGHVEAIMELLDSLRHIYPQLFIISHVGALENAQEIDYHLVFESEKGRDRIALIEA